MDGDIYKSYESNYFLYLLFCSLMIERTLKCVSIFQKKPSNMYEGVIHTSQY